MTGRGIQVKPGATNTIDRRSTRPFLDRKRELESLLDGLADAESGHGRLILVSGEPGIGKTRLASEAADRARERGWQVLWGRCRDEGGAPSFWPWVQVLRSLVAAGTIERELAELGPSAVHLRRILPDAGGRRGAAPAVESEHTRFYLFDAVTQLVRRAASQRPLLLVFDDLHWADRDSLHLLRFLAEDSAETPILTLALYRDVEARQQPAIAETLGDLARLGQVLTLGGLPPPEVGALIEHAVGSAPSHRLIEVIHETTGGNPFFVDELSRLLAAEGRFEDATSAGVLSRRIPQGVRQLVDRRMAVLSAECREALIAAAVIGRSFAIPLLAETVLRSAAETIDLLDAAASSGIVAPDTARVAQWSFTHALYRECLYAGLPQARRLDLHRRVGEALERVAGSELDACSSELAFHFRNASPIGNADKAIEYGVRAGRRAFAESAYDAAVAHFRASLDAEASLARRDDRRHLDLLLELAEVERRSGDVAAAARHFAESVAVARRLELPDRLGRAALHFRGAPGVLGDASDATGRVDAEVVRLLEEGLAGLPPQDDPLRARLLGRLSVSLYWDAEARPRREALADQALAMAARLGDPREIVWALSSKRFALWGPEDPVGRLSDATKLLNLAERIGDRERVLYAREMRLWDFAEIGDLHSFESELDAYEDGAEALRQPFFLGDAKMFRGMLALVRGDFVAGEAFAAEALAFAERAQNPLGAVYYGAQLFRASWELGRNEMLEAAVAGIREGSELSATRCALVFVLAEVGRLDEARVEFERFAADGFREPAFGHGWLVGMALLARTCVTLGDRARAIELGGRLAPYAGHNVMVGPPPADMLGPTTHVLGLLAATAGDHAKAIAYLEQAIKRSAAMAATPFLADSECALAEVLDDAGESERSTVLVRSARERAEGLGLVRIAARAQALAERSRLPSSRAPRATATVFLREGEIWRIAYDGVEVRLRDSRGLRYLARLLNRPGVEVHCGELAADGQGAADLEVATAARSENTPRLGLGDAGEILDARARDQYRARLVELRLELAAAEREDDPERRRSLQGEIDFIAGEMASAVGLGGRVRKAADNAERARKSVANRVRDALGRIAEAHPGLGRHLENSVRMGVFCAYVPERPVGWDCGRLTS